MMSEALDRFNIQESDALTLNVRPLLHEIFHALEHLVQTGQPGIIDLRTIPLAPSEEETILEILGRGEIRAHISALGPSEVYETAYAGVWLVTHYNESNSIIGRFIEITAFPDILKSQHGDMREALAQLAAHLEIRTHGECET